MNNPSRLSRFTLKRVCQLAACFKALKDRGKGLRPKPQSLLLSTSSDLCQKLWNFGQECSI